MSIAHLRGMVRRQNSWVPARARAVVRRLLRAAGQYSNTSSLCCGQHLPQYSKSHREALHGCQSLPQFVVTKACYNIVNVIYIEWSFILISINTLVVNVKIY